MTQEQSYFTADVTTGQKNAVFKELAGQMRVGTAGEVVLGICSREWVLQHRPKFWMEGDLIRFNVVTNGRSGEEWIRVLRSQGKRLSGEAERVLRSPDFIPTTGQNIEVAVLRGELFADRERFTRNVRAEAVRRCLGEINMEVACLIREKFTDKQIEEMGLWWIIVMHQGPVLLGGCRRAGGSWLRADYDGPGFGWYRVGGFAFSVPQVDI
ncbi:MAG: hypothetical protein WC309_00220 [Candidatus Paceibacterota bacterium]|jgi:hypothetical protein